jgi:putative acetyltransferase
MLIRPERASDIEAIRRVNIEAFADHPVSRQTEHLIVEALRADGALAVSLVADVDDEVVGHIALSPAPVGEVTDGWLLVGPVAVLPRLQRRGIGSRLVEAGLAAARKAGALGCVLVGDPAYYGRFGFAACRSAVYEGVPGEYLLGLSFAGDEPVGAVTAHAAFSIAPADGASD